MQSTILTLERVTKDLKTYKSDGTSLITMCIPGNVSMHKFTQKITCEMSTASNIKCRV